ncbi:hypothetical protein D0962_20640 [Leptolyngbyaceae cyanobacterium CCMR0082]|uniref:Uncharacterized protein n=1 Tax=Adonisia turfae CCMR0082 TaxID=2304604 RepID=A0A6M0SBW1_9CYAN|nr:hypothetical protein [Adonisia turfae]NEZ65152.1 hypothetical protein [Adonisia turfae CCMR0082]
MFSEKYFHELSVILLQATSQSKSILDFLEKSIEEHSLIWLISSTTVAAFTASLFKLFFEEIFPSRFRGRSLIIATKRQYSIPTLLAAAELRNRLGNMIRHIVDIENDGWLATENKERYYYVSTLYLVGKFFGWVQILRSTVVYLDMASVSETRKFENYIDLIEKAFSKPDFLPSFPVKVLEEEHHWCYSHELTAIGEMMIRPKAGSKDFQVIGYSTFSRLLLKKLENQSNGFESLLSLLPNFSVNLEQESNEFKEWFLPLQNIFLNLEKEQDSFRRVVAIHYILNAFINYLDPKFIRAKLKIDFVEHYLNTADQQKLRQYLVAVNKKSKVSRTR